VTSVTFETATFADVIKKAEKVAPSTGNAFDKAAGIIIEVENDGAQTILVRATNLNVYSMEWVDFVKMEGPSTKWRVPSKVFAQVVGSLPIGSGSHVTIREIDNKGRTFLELSCGRTKAKFNLMDPDHYPIWSAFDPDDLIKADNLGGRIAQVEWAAAKSDATPQIEGVHFDGNKCIATDRFRLATVDLSIPDLPQPVTVPAGILGQLLKQTGEVRIGVDDKQLLLMPDDTTQYRAILFGGEYPHIGKIMIRDQPDAVTVKKAALLEVMTRASNFAGSERFPKMTMFFGAGEIAVMMTQAEIGLLGDVVEVPGQIPHDRVMIYFTPRNLMEAITAAPNDEIIIKYDHEQPEAIMYIDGGSGYEAWVKPRKAMEPATDA
jgi:DNA polymerase III sliding clamp (beta) subunit (PCNA family)